MFQVFKDQLEQLKADKGRRGRGGGRDHDGSDTDTSSLFSSTQKTKVPKAELDDKGYHAKSVQNPNKPENNLPNMTNLKQGELRNLETWRELKKQGHILSHNTFKGSDIGKRTWKCIIENVENALTRYADAESAAARKEILVTDTLSRYERDVADHLWTKFETRSPGHIASEIKQACHDEDELPRVEQLIFRIAIICLPQGWKEKKRLTDNFEHANHFSKVWRDFSQQRRAFLRDLKLLEDFNVINDDYSYNNIFRRVYDDIYESDLLGRHVNSDDFYKCFTTTYEKFDKKFMHKNFSGQIPRSALTNFLELIDEGYCEATERGAQTRSFTAKLVNSGNRRERSESRDSRNEGYRSPRTGLWRTGRTPSPARANSDTNRNRQSSGSRDRDGKNRQPSETRGRGRDSPRQSKARAARHYGDTQKEDKFCTAYGTQDQENCDCYVRTTRTDGTTKKVFTPLQNKPQVWDSNNCCTDRSCPGRSSEGIPLVERKCKHTGQELTCKACGVKGHSEARCYKCMPWLYDEHKKVLPQRGRSPAPSGTSSRRPSTSSADTRRSGSSKPSTPRDKRDAGKPTTPRASKSPRGTKSGTTTPPRAHGGNSPKPKSPRSNPTASKTGATTTSSFRKGGSGRPTPK